MSEWEKGIAALLLAAQADKANQVAEAVRHYEAGVAHMLEHLKQPSAPQDGARNAALRLKIGQYIKRCEELRLLLQSALRPPEPPPVDVVLPTGAFHMPTNHGSHPMVGVPSAHSQQSHATTTSPRSSLLLVGPEPSSAGGEDNVPDWLSEPVLSRGSAGHRGGRTLTAASGSGRVHGLVPSSFPQYHAPSHRQPPPVHFPNQPLPTPPLPACLQPLSSSAPHPSIHSPHPAAATVLPASLPAAPDDATDAELEGLEDLIARHDADRSQRRARHAPPPHADPPLVPNSDTSVPLMQKAAGAHAADHHENNCHVPGPRPRRTSDVADHVPAADGRDADAGGSEGTGCSGGPHAAAMPPAVEDSGVDVPCGDTRGVDGSGGGGCELPESPAGPDGAGQTTPGELSGLETPTTPDLELSLRGDTPDVQAKAIAEDFRKAASFNRRFQNQILLDLGVTDSDLEKELDALVAGGS